MTKLFGTTASAFLCLPLLVGACAEDPSTLTALTPVTQAAFEAAHGDLAEPEFIAGIYKGGSYRDLGCGT